MYSYRIIVLLCCVTLPSTIAYEVNISRVEACNDLVVPATVDLFNITYDMVDNKVDTFHGYYTVKTIDTTLKELEITTYRCHKDSDSSIDCHENPKVQDITMHEMECSRFHSDSSGPWFLFSLAMTGSRCGEELGTFKLDTATLKPKYLKGYVEEDDKDHTRYTMRLKFHVAGDKDDTATRACVYFHFDVLF